MKTSSKHMCRPVSRAGQSSKANPASAQFLGHKVLDELRILMRLATPGSGRGRPVGVR